MTKARPHVAMALYGDPTHDRRVQLEAASLSSAGYDCTIVALGPPHQGHMEIAEGVTVISWQPTASEVVPGVWSKNHTEGSGSSDWTMRGGRLGWLAGYVRNLRAWGRWAVRAVDGPTVWHAHDLTALAALSLGGISAQTRLVYDSHELYLESGSAARLPRPGRSLLARFERRLARRASGVITVNPSIATELFRRYAVDSVVVMNCPPLVQVERPGLLRAHLALGDRPVLLYHGSVTFERGLERAIEALQLLPADVSLVVLGDGPLVSWIRGQQEKPGLSGRLIWHPAVPVNELMWWVVDADLGLILFEPSALNFLLATPNRLFDCMAAGVPVLASNFPELRRIVLGEEIGNVCDPTDTQVVAESIARMLGDPQALAAMRQRGRDAARRTYNWDAQAVTMLELYDRVLSPSGLP